MSNIDKKYEKLVKKIKRKKLLIFVLVVIAVAVNYGLTDSFLMAIPGFVGIFFLELFAVAIAIAPLNSSLNDECDPEKYLALNEGAGNKTQRVIARATGSFYVGDFDRALEGAEEMLGMRRADMRLSGMFNKARALFFLGRAEEARAMAKEYGDTVAGMTKVKEKHLEGYNKLGAMLNLMLAISERDSQRIERFREEVSPWNRSRATEGFVCYMKGLAAFLLSDTHESVYYFRTVKENCPKTFLARYAEQYLAELKRTEDKGENS